MVEAKDAELVEGAAASHAGGTGGDAGGGSDRLRNIGADAGARRKRGPYKKRGNNPSNPGSQNVAAPNPPQPQPAGPPLFTPENTARLVRLPFAVAAIRSNCIGLALDDQEEKELATSGAVVLNEWCAVDSKWVALALFGISLSGIAITKILIYTAYIERLKLEQAKLAARERGHAKEAVAHGAATTKPAAEAPAVVDALGPVPFGPSAIPPSKG